MNSSAVLKEPVEQEVTQETSSWKYENVGDPLLTKVKVPKNATFIPAKNGKPAYWHFGRLVEPKTKTWENSHILGVSELESPAGKTKTYLVQAVKKSHPKKGEFFIFNLTPTDKKPVFETKFHHQDLYLDLNNNFDPYFIRFAFGEEMLVVFKKIT